jgi:hypothetical protein
MLKKLKIREELLGTVVGFRHEAYLAAASFCAQNKVALEQGLQWAELPLMMDLWAGKILDHFLRKLRY